MHGATSHDYSEIKANKVLALVADFIKEATDLYEEMTGLSFNDQETIDEQN